MSALAVLGLASAGVAQVPKVGNEYKDEVDLGFKIKMPDWDFIPPQPHETYNIGRYFAGSLGILVDPKTGRGLVELDVQLLKFDRRKQPGTEEGGESDEAGEGEGLRVEDPPIANFDALMKEYNADWKENAKQRKELAINKVPAVRHVYDKDFGEIAARRLAYEYRLSPEIDIVMIATGPGDEKKWGRWESVFESMAKSFRTVELTTKLEGARSSALRDVKRAELQKEVAKNPGWALYETPNYFIVSSKNDDKLFIEELMERLEAIRLVYEKLYPAELAKELNDLAKQRKAKEAEAAKERGDPESPDAPEGGEGEGEEDDPEREWRTVAEKADSAELSKCSVVRVCKDQEEYHSYGGPGGSAGYWSAFHKELVVFDDKARGGRDNTWKTLNHEAFHQYIYYFFGELAPHSWYNEGTGDFFSGFQLEHKRFELKPFDWRERLVQGNMRASLKDPGTKIVPLQKFVYWTQREYYGQNSANGTSIGDHYAQGWSFIYFLRTGAGKAKGWNPAWSTILDTYLRVLVETDDLKTASDAAFAGIDWAELESCWKNYILAS